jgi:hypothetical protein
MNLKIEDCPSYLHNLRFSREKYDEKEKIYIFGIDLGTEVIVKECLINKYEIWNVPSHTMWGGIGMERSLQPSCYYLVNIYIDEEKKERANFLYEIAPGNKWRSAITELKNLTLSFK